MKLSEKLLLIGEHTFVWVVGSIAFCGVVWFLAVLGKYLFLPAIGYAFSGVNICAGTE